MALWDGMICAKGDCTRLARWGLMVSHRRDSPGILAAARFPLRGTRRRCSGNDVLLGAVVALVQATIPLARLMITPDHLGFTRDILCKNLFKDSLSLL